MKRTTIYLYAALALLLGLAACTQDELSSPSGGVEGAPIVFTATGLNPAATAAGTRAPVDGNWEGVTSVAVLIGGTVKAYDVTPTTADNTSATLTSTDPHYWADHNDMRVTAWWPYNGEENLPAVKVRADQSTQDGYEGSDFIAAEEQAVSYANPTLRFTHRTALVHIVLTKYTDGLKSVQLTGLSTGGGNPAVIIPYDKGNHTYSALVAPQMVTAGTAFITCTFTDGKTFGYRMQESVEWKAGEEYTYTVSLAAADPVGYTVSADGKTYTVYNANGLLAWAKAAWTTPTLNCTLADDIDLTDKEWVPMGETGSYTGTFDGGGHRITGLTATGSKYAGLIGFIGLGGTVQNVTLEDVKIGSNISGYYVGGVAGRSFGKIENCSVSGSVNGDHSVIGGVVGEQVGGSITGCSSSATVYSKGIVAGGVVGSNSSGTLIACYAWSKVTCSGRGTIDVGGVVGSNSSGTLIACYAWGKVTVENNNTGTNYAGGVVGSNSSGTLIACYAWGKVTGSGSGPIYVGGVTGTNKSGTLTACYWNNSLATGIGTGNYGGVTKVDGSTTWQTAQSGMNDAIDAWNKNNPNKPCNWHYAETDAETPPTLTENNTTNP